MQLLQRGAGIAIIEAFQTARGASTGEVEFDSVDR
jgi:hypothetical protein